MAMHISGSRLAGLLLGQPVEATRGPAYLRLAAAVRTLVLDGRVPVGARLPAERELATRLGVSRTTVTGAYAALRETGHATARQGAGTFTALPPGRSLGGGPLMAEAGGAVDLDLAVAAPGPADGVLDALTEAVAALPAHLGDHGYHPAGLPVLREAVAARFTARGLPTSPTQVVVTAGAQAAIDLVARHLLRAGDAVVVENPTYPNAVDALRRAGARLVGTPVDEQGWDTDSIAEAYARSRPRLGYHVVDFHNPTGLLLDDPGRARLVEAASSTGATLLVDETQAELGLDGGPAPRPVAAFDREGRVVTVGSMSKAFWGGLRIGWVRTSPGMAARLAEERAIVDMASPVVDQLTAVVLLGAADRLLPARRAELRRRRDRLTAALSEHLPGWTCPPPPGGVCAWARLDEPVSTALTAAAGRRGLRLAAGPRFGLDGTLERYLRLPYTLPADDLEEAVRRLAAARAELGSGSAGLGSVPAVA